MAFMTRSEGGSGFSLDASLMTSVSPNSRSSSSMGFPGSYGAIPRMWSFASDSQGTGMRDSLRGRVRSEDFEELTALLDLGQDGADVIGIAMAFEVDEVDVLPGAPLRRSRFDFREIQPAGGEGLENAVEHAGLVFHREENRRLVPPRGRRRLPADHEEAGGVGRVVLDPRPEHGHLVQPRGELRG